MKRAEFLKSLIVAPVAISQIDFSTPVMKPKNVLFWFNENTNKIFLGCKTDFPLTKVKSL